MQYYDEDPLQKSWTVFEEEVHRRIAAPMSVADTLYVDPTEKVKQTQYKFQAVADRMNEFLQELNDEFFCDPEIVQGVRVRVEPLKEEWR